MELLGHLGLALFVYSPFAYLVRRGGRPRRAWLGLAGVLTVSMTPDVDLYLSFVPHRGVTHTVWAAIAAGCVLALIGCSRPRSGTGIDRSGVRCGAVVGVTSVGSHLLGDAMTPMGIRPFLPVSDTAYTLSLVTAADPTANLALFVTGVVTVPFAVTRGPGTAAIQSVGRLAGDGWRPRSVNRRN